MNFDDIVNRCTPEQRKALALAAVEVLREQDLYDVLTDALTEAKRKECARRWLAESEVA